MENVESVNLLKVGEEDGNSFGKSWISLVSPIKEELNKSMVNNYSVVTIENNKDFLRQISRAVDIEKDTKLQDDIKVLDGFCKANSVMAMAAVQLWIPKRLVYLKNTNLELIQRMQRNETTDEDELFNESRVLINPKVIKREWLTEYWEACRSCLDNFCRVLRPYSIGVEYFDVQWEKHKDIFEWFESTVLSHELDHLDWILHMDVAEESMIMPVEGRKVWRQTHDYHIFSKTGDYEELKKNFSWIKL